MIDWIVENKANKLFSTLNQQLTYWSISEWPIDKEHNTVRPFHHCSREQGCQHHTRSIHHNNPKDLQV